MTGNATYGVVFQPKVANAFGRGVDAVVDLIRPTLGPLPRLVAVASPLNGRVPELLDSGGLIARRMIALADRDADVGAMFVRHMLWRLHEEFGDGTATAAVLFGALFRDGRRFLAAGGDAMRLRRELSVGAALLDNALAAQAMPIGGKAKLAQLAESVCYDATLAGVLGEIFDIIGEHGQLDIRRGHQQGIEREYIEGMYWESGLLSWHMLEEPIAQRVQLHEAALLLSDLDIESPQQLIPLLEQALAAGVRALVIVAKRISAPTLAWLLAQRRAGLQIIAVKTPGATPEEQFAALDDLAALTGGRLVLAAAGDRLHGVCESDFGRARRVWADRSLVGVVGGKGNARALRRHIADLRARLDHSTDSLQRKRLKQRIGRMLGGAATLWVGGASDSAIAQRVNAAERAASALRGACSGGTLPGGGTTLLACRAALMQWRAGELSTEQRAARGMLLRAIELPSRTIIANAGHDVSATLAAIARAGAGHGLDVRTGQVVDMPSAGILDVAEVQRAAVGRAISSAALALTIDVVVHPKKPLESLANP